MWKAKLDSPVGLQTQLWLDITMITYKNQRTLILFTSTALLKIKGIHILEEVGCWPKNVSLIGIKSMITSRTCQPFLAEMIFPTLQVSFQKTIALMLTLESVVLKTRSGIPATCLDSLNPTQWMIFLRLI